MQLLSQTYLLFLVSKTGHQDLGCYLFGGEGAHKVERYWVDIIGQVALAGANTRTIVCEDFNEVKGFCEN